MKKSIYKDLGAIDTIIRYINEHQTLCNIVLIIEALALIWAVYNYHFTTNF